MIIASAWRSKIGVAIELTQVSVGDGIKTKTFYKVLSYNKKISLIKFVPKTGKKHQLRIVAKNLGSPIVGDLKYNLNLHFLINLYFNVVK